MGFGAKLQKKIFEKWECITIYRFTLLNNFNY